MMTEQGSDRRDFLKTAGAALTTSLFTGKVKGANDRIRGAVIGLGDMGEGNLEYSMDSGVEIAALCDVYEPNLDKGMRMAEKAGHKPRRFHDFREILADKSIDIVNISAPDNWHAYMTVEACKAGKDVYVEKPISVTPDEGWKMVQAARKYNRVVQAGTMQRSADVFQRAVEIVRNGQLGEVKVCRTFNTGNSPKAGMGNPPDSNPPAGLDWDLWLGPAPMRPFNKNRFLGNFRWFWDYAGGMVTDWCVHVLDIVHFAFDDPVPKSVAGIGGKVWYTDNRETPDTLQLAYEYPGFTATYEFRSSNGNGLFDQGYGTVFYGSEATLFVNRRFCRVIPEKKGGEITEIESTDSGNRAHWANFLECVRTRQRPASDIEKCYRSTLACQLGNIAYRTGLRVDWDAEKNTTVQDAARQLLSRQYRPPWKLEV